MIGRRAVLGMGLGAAGLGAMALAARHEVLEKRVRAVVPGRIVRGAWQRPIPLRRLIARERLRTIVTLTAINRDDPKYVAQRDVVDAAGVDWLIVPMRGSTATLLQLAVAADLLADPARQPLFFHCVAGHHRTNLAHAAFRIRHAGWDVERAWDELLSLPWTDPRGDGDDRALLEAFARRELDRRGRRGLA